MRIGAGLMKKGRLVNNLDKWCVNKKIFAHPTLAEVLNHKRGLSLPMVKRLHEGLNIPYESLLSAA